MGNRTTDSRSKAACAVEEIYRPILRGYFAIFGVYYLSMLPNHAAYLSGYELFSVTSVAFMAAITGIFGTWFMRKPAKPHQVELLLVAMNLLVVSNVYVALNLLFASEKLTYFVIMAVLFALGSPSFRQSAFSIGVACVALISFFPRVAPETAGNFGYIVFGSAMASLSIAFFLRKAITDIADAKIEAEKQLEDARLVGEEMREKSLSDSLTMLPNRRAFFAALRKAVQKTTNQRAAGAPNANIWLILIDLDGFKAVNDIHGHLTGDLLLKQVAGRLERFARDTLHVSRMGGDEFNLILQGADSDHEVQEKCQGLLDLLAEIYIIEGRHIKISCSVGCKLIDLGESTRSQISLADYALMVAKRRGKNRVVLFDDNHAKQAKERYAIEEALRQADLAKEIDLVFQPQVDLRTNKIVRNEALARWHSPLVGEIEPQRFITIAEETGLITGITLVVVEKAIKALQSWSRPIPLSINLSSYDLISDPTIAQIVALTENYGLDQSLVEFEVTETAMMADFDKAAANLHKLADLGFSIALDDFGTGYSNFSYLRALPIDKLKVDRSFIENPGDPMTEKMLSSLAGMARILGVKCLFEGIEDEMDLMMAKRAGADSVQGYLFGKPMAADELFGQLHLDPTDSEPFQATG